MQTQFPPKTDEVSETSLRTNNTTQKKGALVDRTTDTLKNLG